jgi:hypothetical protein
VVVAQQDRQVQEQTNVCVIDMQRNFDPFVEPSNHVLVADIRRIEASQIAAMLQR